MDEHTIRRGPIMRPARLNHRLLSLFVAVSLGVAEPVLAAEFTGDVPLPLVRALLHIHNGAEPRVHSDVPDSFPEILIPAGFTVLGGMERGPTRLLILQTNEERDEALAAISQALLDAGFRDVEALAGRQMSGFLTERDLSTRTFCREGEGILGVTYVVMSQEAHVILNAPDARDSDDTQSCANFGAPPTMPVSATARMDALMQHMPAMTIPDAVDTSRRPYLGGAGGGSASQGTYETSTDFGSSMTIPQLYQHFTEQIASQGWALDGESIGQVSASGNWIKIPDGDTYLHGLFSIVQSSASNFSIRFRLTKLSVEQ